MNATSESQSGHLRLQIVRSIKLTFCRSSIRSDGGLLLLRELDDALGLTDLMATVIANQRVGKNSHFQSKSLHPLFVFNQFGDLERCALRPGHVHSADGWEDSLMSVLARYSAEVRLSVTRRHFRMDAAFTVLNDRTAGGRNRNEESPVRS